MSTAAKPVKRARTSDAKIVARKEAPALDPALAAEPAPAAEPAAEKKPARKPRTKKQPEPQPAPQPLKVLLCASEAMPFIKTGGLADVVGALPVALNQEGLDVRVIIPKYRLIPPTPTSAPWST